MSDFALTRGVGGDCLVLDGTRIAGPKPWGGGRVVTTFTTKEKYVPERTCKNVSGYDDVFECSECRCKVEIIGECGNEHGELFHVPYMPAYCPGCGAEVVGE